MADSYLDLQSAKVDYREMLSPPEGYVIDYAVGSSYSLDLQALLIVPIALGTITDVGDDIQNINRLYILRAIAETKKHFSIFCNADGIKVPQIDQDSTFHKLLDDCVFTVKKEGHSKSHPNFHPKVWIISYKRIDAKEPEIVRVGVLSRNLTFDNSFDIATFVDGTITSKSAHNQALCNFLTFLNENNPSQYHKKKINGLKKYVARVKEFKCPDLFSKVKFHFFNGCKPYPFTPQSLCENVSGLAIVSPFLTWSTVKKAFALDSRKENDFRRLLVTRQFQYTRQIKGFNNDEVLGFCEDSEDFSRDIHAKIIFQERRNDSNRLFVGSLNLTENAFKNNVEFMAEFEFAKRKKNVSFKAFKEIFTKDSVFKSIMPLTNEEKEQEEISFEEFFENIIYDKCVVGENKITLKFKQSIPEFKIKMLGMKNGSYIPISKNTCCLRYDSKKDICEFFVVKRQNKEIVVKIPLIKKPEERDNELINSLFKDGGMIEYLKMLLPGANVFKANGKKKEGKSRSPKLKNIYEDNLYENMLKLMRDDDCRIRLKNLQDTLKGLSQNNSTADKKNTLEKLKKLVNLFSDAVKDYYRK